MFVLHFNFKFFFVPKKKLDEASVAHAAAQDAQKFKHEMELLSLEQKLSDQDIAIASLHTSLLVVQGNARFLLGQNESYTNEEVQWVEQKFRQVLEVMKGKARASEPLHRCVACQNQTVTNLSLPCLCFAYCLECLPKKGAHCKICGVMALN